MPIKFIRQRSKAAFDRLRVADLDSSIAKIEAWAGQDFGRYLLHQEQQLLQRKYAQLPGYRLMHLGLATDEQTLTGFDQLHSFHLAPGLAGASGAAAISNYAQAKAEPNRQDLIAYLIKLCINKLFKYACGIKCMYAETVGCIYAHIGCLSIERLGATMRMLGASMRMLGACLWNGWMHVCVCWVHLWGMGS